MKIEYKDGIGRLEHRPWAEDLVYIVGYAGSLTNMGMMMAGILTASTLFGLVGCLTVIMVPHLIWSKFKSEEDAQKRETGLFPQKRGYGVAVRVWGVWIPTYKSVATIKEYRAWRDPSAPPLTEPAEAIR